MGLALVTSACSHEKPETQEDIQKWNQETLKDSCEAFGQPDEFELMAGGFKTGKSMWPHVNGG